MESNRRQNGLDKSKETWNKRPGYTQSVSELRVSEEKLIKPTVWDGRNKEEDNMARQRI